MSSHRRPDATPVRLVRIISRLNIGGPAIQAITLTERLTPLGYDTTLIRGSEAADEGNMDYLAADLGVRPVRIAVAGAESRPERPRRLGRPGARAPCPAAAHRALARGEGRDARAARRPARLPAQPAAHPRPHLPRALAQRLLLQPAQRALPADRALPRAPYRPADRGVRGGPRRARRARRGAARALCRRAARVRPLGLSGRRLGARGAAVGAARRARHRRRTRWS